MWRTVLRVLALVTATLALPVVAGAAGIVTAVDDIYPERPGGAETLPATAPRLEPSRPTVAIVVGGDGANSADVLGPHEAFATTGEFNVVTVAPSDAPVVLTGGLDLVPDLSFDALANRLSGPPDVIVVPQIHGDSEDVVEWLREQRRHGAPLVMGVCAGVEVLADAELLEDRSATSHWLKLIGLRRSHPDVDWTDGVRFVDDGEVLTTAGVLSGIDGALRVVERLVDRTTAEATARALRWNGYPDASVEIPASRPGAGDVVALLSAAYRWQRPTTGVLLADGVGEIELAAATRPYTELSYLSRLHTLSSDGDPVRSRHGLTFLPRSDWDTAAPDLDRLLLPGDTAREVASTLPDRDVTTVDVHDAGEFPFDGALRDIATTYDAATAAWVAKSLQYPAPPSDPDDRRWPWLLTAVPLLLAAVGAAAFLLVRRLAVLAGHAGRRPGDSSRRSASQPPTAGTTASHRAARGLSLMDATSAMVTT